MDLDCRHSLFSRGNEFLGTTYPIMGGAMTWLSEEEFSFSNIECWWFWNYSLWFNAV